MPSLPHDAQVFRRALNAVGENEAAEKVEERQAGKSFVHCLEAHDDMVTGAAALDQEAPHCDRLRTERIGGLRRMDGC